MTAELTNRQRINQAVHDDTTDWVVPAITLGYAVENDPNGKFRFFTRDVQIIYRCGEWIAQDLEAKTDPDRHYPGLRTALEREA